MCWAVAMGCWTGPGWAAIQTETIEYTAGSVKAKGFLAWDDAITGPRPGVLVVHEWWGLNDYARDRARQLAEMGYVAFAADLYGDGKTAPHPKEAGEMAGQVRANVADWRARASAAVAVLKRSAHVDPTRLAAIGYCFGGATALQLGLAGEDLKAIATFHAGFVVPALEEAKKIKAGVLVCHGAQDGFVPEATLQQFRQVLDEAHVDYEVVYYGGARHSFTVPDAGTHGVDGLRYSETADRRSWQRLTQFLEEKFSP